MENWKIVLLTGGISLVTAILSSLVTTRMTRRNEVKRLILDERTKLYFEIFPLIDSLINHPFKIYQKDFMELFLPLKAKMKLLASKDTSCAYQRFMEPILDAVNKYDVYMGYIDGEDPEMFDEHIFSSLNDCDFGLDEPEFAKKYLPDRDVLDQLILKLYQEMRKDLGSNLN